MRADITRRCEQQEADRYHTNDVTIQISHVGSDAARACGVRSFLFGSVESFCRGVVLIISVILK